ncbi:zwei Ig domain protein zig-8-like [Daphnia carinata]|uniref:zwei Ig domain protein zig-8-like n=1 Tax=Daphnia carinata TaxID=120202 RepID=UPI00257A7BD8|nr:zwei Ig domain protein zig-8-like [Daphnia carinata]
MWPTSLTVSLLMLILQCACQPTESEPTEWVGVVEDEAKQPDVMEEHQEYESSQTMRIKPNAVERPSITTSLRTITATAKNVTVAHGKMALLTCKIGAGLLDNRTQVAWIRYADLQLLTVGNQTYTADRRFSAGISGNGDAWSLQISHVQFRDEGGYECQIGGTPRVSHYIHLSVVEPTTVILGGSEMHIDIGSTINLTCLVQHTPEPPDYVFWTHNQQTVNYDSKRGGISVMVERGATTLSSLLIQKAARRDSGVYVCSPSSAPAAQASIHILEGERPAAMYSVGTTLVRRPPIGMLTLVFIAMYLTSARQRPF